MSAPTVDFGDRGVVVRAAGIAVRWRLRTLVVSAVLAAAATVLTALAVMMGDYAVSLDRLGAVLVGDPAAGFARVVVLEWRLPRALAAVVLGAALGVSGALFQSVTRNPLASPDVIGFTSGSYTGALLVILASGSYLQVAGAALAGGLVTASAVYLLAWRRGIQGFRFIVVGIAVSAILLSVNTWLILTAQLEAAIAGAVWGAGSLNGVNWEQLVIGGSIVAVLLVLLVPLAPGLRQLELGDDAALATGARAERVRLAAMAVGVALAATATAVAGPVSFVALAAPQIARRLVRGPGVALGPAMVTGAVLLAAADLVAQHLFPTALPVGVVTVVVGGAYLIWLLLNEIRRRI